LIIDFRRLVSGSWPLTTGEMSSVLGGGHDMARGSALAGPAAAVALCGVVTVMVYTTQHHCMIYSAVTS